MPSRRTLSADGEVNETSSSAKNTVLMSDQMKTHSALSQLKQASAGALSGCLTRTLTQPFDVLKIRFQLQVEPVSSTTATIKQTRAARVASKYTSMMQAFRVIHRDEGLLAFWKGHNAGQFNSVLYALVQFWSYEQFHLGVAQMPWMSEHAHVTSFVSGGLAGCVATCFSMPFDVIRTRVVAQDHGAGYKSILHAFPTILRNEGVPGLFRGLGTTLIQIGPLVGLNFMFYHFFNDFASKILEEPNEHLPAWIHLMNGGAAGITAKSLVYPLDFIKKRLQLQGFEQQRQTFGRTQACTGISHCIRLTIHDEGILGFYKGMTPTLFKSGLTTALYFSFYDKFKTLLVEHHH